MIQPSAHLADGLFSETLLQEATRDGFGVGLLEAGKEHPEVIALCADLMESTRMEVFQKAFPERTIDVGVAEQNLVTVASGMAAMGKIPFAASYAAFSPGRNYEQIRTTIALNEQPVVLCGMHAGVSVGPDGATHQMLEDIGLMRMLPNMTVVVPGDAEEARKAVHAAIQLHRPVYLRFGRTKTQTFTTTNTSFVIGKGIVVWDESHPQLAILSTGSLTYEALLAARALSASGTRVRVLHLPTVKPLDIELVETAARDTGHIITLEEHQIAGGFGSAVAEHLSGVYPVRIERVGVDDQFGQSGTPEELYEAYQLSAPHIIERAKKLLHP